MHRLLTALFALFLIAAASAHPAPSADLSAYQPVPYVKLTHPEWSKDATIYQINTRQFTPEGTFKAAEAQLPRLHELGVGILWLMPVNPIGKKNRKGTLGSPYAVADYLAVNPEFGSMDDLKHFVATAHGLGMHVILDWVANHTAWDNPLLQQHPEWYARDYKGDFIPTPWADWTDIVQLDYSHPGLRQYMTEAMKFWVRQADVDGFRCDVAGYVPVDFWNQARKELDAIKPVFMLAEWEQRDLHEHAFDMTYSWTFYDALRAATSDKPHDAGALGGYYGTNESSWPQDAMRMTFLSNHDMNSWNGTEFDIFGNGVQAGMVLSMTGEGLPLIYNGQEAGFNKRLQFFERDPIRWQPHANGELYRKLIALKKQNTALWNAHWGARMIYVPNSAKDAVFSFVRRNEHDKVFVAINFSAQPQTVTFSERLYWGSYTDYLSGERVTLDAASKVTLPAWGYKVFVK